MGEAHAMKCYAVEGNTQRLDGGAMFGNVPKVLWEKWIPADEQNRIPLACRALFVQTDEGRNILFETGIGAFFEPKLRERYGVVEIEHMLLKNLEALGVLHTDVDAIILSHLHFDHAGGLLTPFGEPPRLLFPNAVYYVSEDHWNRSQQPHLREKASYIPILNDMLRQSNRLVLIKGPTHPDLDFGVSFRFSHGHTKGLMLSKLETSSGPLVFVSDLIPGLPWVHLPVTMGYDRYPELLVDEKKLLYEDLAGENAKLFFTHDPENACAVLKQGVSGKYYGEPDSIY
jgi:glyoxylase-like metal-dependent hydrolase (beta-lactamase superfamily II)